MGLTNQVAQAMDDSITQEVTNTLFKKPGNRFGVDLVSFNIQRGREFGLPGFMEYRLVWLFISVSVKGFSYDVSCLTIIAEPY